MARYQSKQAAYDDFNEIWGRMYGSEVPSLRDAERYSGNDRAETWHKNVLFYLNS